MDDGDGVNSEPISTRNAEKPASQTSEEMLAEPTNRWEEIKPEFVRLYVEEGKSLDTVRQELKERYSFDASKSAFTRQIKEWKAWKNIKAPEARRLEAQRMRGQRPEHDSQGQPIRWDRVFRATRARTAQAQRLKVENRRRALITAARPQTPPVDLDSRVVRLVSDIWQASTRHFASQNLITPEYHAQYERYHGLIRCLNLISMSSDSLWPQDPADELSKEMVDLIKQQPAMACEVFIFLIKKDPADANESVKKLKNHLFGYMRGLSKIRLRQNDPLRRMLWTLDDRESYTKLGSVIAIAKLDAMWKTSTNEIGDKTYYQRPFFRQVLMQAFLVLSDYGESHRYAAEFLLDLSKPHGRGATKPQICDIRASASSDSGAPVDPSSRARRNCVSAPACDPP